VNLVQLRDAMLARKEKLLKEAENGGLPPARPRVIQLVPA